MYTNEVETKEKEKLPEIKNLLQHIQIISLHLSEQKNITKIFRCSPIDDKKLYKDLSFLPLNFSNFTYKT